MTDFEAKAREIVTAIDGICDMECTRFLVAACPDHLAKAIAAALAEATREGREEYRKHIEGSTAARLIDEIEQARAEGFAAGVASQNNANVTRAFAAGVEAAAGFVEPKCGEPYENAEYSIREVLALGIRSLAAPERKP